MTENYKSYYSRPMHGSVQNYSNYVIPEDKEQEFFIFAMTIYQDFARKANNGIVDRFNKAWDLLHPEFIREDADVDDEYLRSYYLISAMILEELAVEYQDKFGYYILLDPEEPCTFAGDFSQFWINIKEIKQIR